MILIVAGGRDYEDALTVFYFLDRIHEREGIREIVSGGCRGADRLGEIWACKNRVMIRKFEANWKDGKKAGPMRNKNMARYADAVALFPGGKGTESMYREAESYELKIFDYREG